MEELVTSGRAVDLILLLVCAEALLLLVWRRQTGRGPRLTALLPNLLAGVALLATVRLALTDAPWGWLAGALSLALLAHLLDLGSRWEQA
jgi:hypothetical protein